MKIGFMGLGKLGLPCALAIEAAGHEVCGYDPSPHVKSILQTKQLPYREEGAQALLDNSNIQLCSIQSMAQGCDIVFVAVQTPHDPDYEGITRLPEERVDFDYTYLVGAMRDLVRESNREGRVLDVVVISTVLPGTVDRLIRPILEDRIRLCYNPFFIAMGTTIHDFTHPEFVLFGVDDPSVADKAESFYKTLHSRPFYRTTIRNAELIKVAYNTFISTKIAFVNTLMEVCHKTGCDVDAVTDALKLATDRLISPKYMSGGMGDGGGCHPRDNIALSWLARKLEMRYDFFEAIMLSREAQTEWFASLVQTAQQLHGMQLPVVILGEAFKPETNLTVGSPAVLLKNVLFERGIVATLEDPVIHGSMRTWPMVPAVYFVGCKHQAFATMSYPAGSVVIDPHRYVPDQPGVVVIRLGEARQ